MPEQELQTNEPSDGQQSTASADKKTNSKTKTYLWAAFGVACVLALVLPAAWVVYTNTQGSGDTPSIADPAPATPTPGASEEETQTTGATGDGATVNDEAATELGEDREMWDYSTSGRNVFKSTIPVKLTTSTNTNNDNDEIESDDIILKWIGKNSDDEYVAIFTVKGKQYEVGTGAQIGTTGWYVKTITASSVSLSRTSGSVDKSLDEDTAGK